MSLALRRNVPNFFDPELELSNSNPDEPELFNFFIRAFYEPRHILPSALKKATAAKLLTMSFLLGISNS